MRKFDFGIDTSDLQVAVESRYPIFYRQQGIRFFTQFLNPQPFPLSQLDDVEYAIWHYYHPKQGEKDTYGIPTEHPFVKNPKASHGVYHILDYPKIEGPYRKKPARKMLCMKSYHHFYRNLYWFRTPAKLNTAIAKRRWNIIVDYTLMDFGIEWRNNPSKQVFMFNTQYGGYLNGIKEQLSKYKLRQHFMQIFIPEQPIAPIARFRQATKEFRRQYYDSFSTYGAMQLLDLWKWIDPKTRAQSLFGKFIRDQDLQNLNFLFTCRGQVVVLRASLLNDWIVGKEKTDDIKDDDVDIGIDEEVGDEFTHVDNSKARRVQIRFWKFLTKLQQLTSAPTGAIDDQLETYAERQAEEIEKIYETNTEETLKDSDFQDPDLVTDTNNIQNDPPAIEPESLTGSPPDEIPNTSVPKDDKQVAFAGSKVSVSSPSELDPTLNQPNEPVPQGQMSYATQLETKASKQVDLISEQLMMTDRERKHWQEVTKAMKKIKSPVNKSASLEDYVNEKPPRTMKKGKDEVPDMPLVTDKSMLDNTLKTFHRDYIRNHLKRDITKSIVSLQRTGIFVTGYEIEESRDVASEYDIHVIQYTPAGGSPSTVRLRLPKIREDGTFRKAMVNYRIRSQRRDKPIRKVSDGKSSLTSYYGKLFITKCTRRAFDQAGWMTRELNRLVIENEYLDVVYGHTTPKQANLPDYLQAMMKNVRSFSVKGPTGKPVKIDLTDIREVGQKLQLGQDGPLLHPKTHKITFQNQDFHAEDFLKFSPWSMPATFAEVKILGEMMPVGFVLARSMGFRTLVAKLGLTPMKYETGKRYEKTNNDLTLKFADETWVFDRSTMTEKEKLLIAGFLNYSKHLKQHSVYDFDDKDIYGTILSEEGVAIRYERELDLIEEMFVDPMTEELLVKMNEPTEINDLLIRATELLSESHAVSEINMDDMVVKGYERIPGAVYAALVSNLRQFKGKPVTYKRKFDMRPDDALLLICNDPTTEIVDEINPIHNVKEKANMTYVGEGGRSKRSMVKGTRGYDDSDIGIVSEGSVDSSDIGVTTYLSASPVLDTLMGEKEKHRELGAANILSTSVMLAPFGQHDDMKRNLFSTTQASHRIPIRGAMPNPIRTGYETVLAHNTDPSFAYAAEQDGHILDKGSRYLSIQYKDGTQMSFEIGPRVASSKGSFFRHIIECDLEPGQKFKKGDIILFNASFFVRDCLNPTQVIVKDKTYMTVAIMDNNDTFEDSSAISAYAKSHLESKMVKERTMVVDAKDHITDLVKIGEDVDIEDALFLIQNDQMRQVDDKFGKHSAEVLRRLSRIAPKAGVKGKVVKIECYYFCEEEELSDSLRDITNEIKRSLLAGTKKKVADVRAMSGQVNEPLKIKNQFLTRGKVAIRIFIEHTLSCGAGDKFVFNNQLKTVTSRVFTEEHKTESGREINAMFSYASISARIVASPEITGTLYTLLKHVTKKALQAYDGIADKEKS